MHARVHRQFVYFASSITASVTVPLKHLSRQINPTLHQAEVKPQDILKVPLPATSHQNSRSASGNAHMGRGHAPLP
jgi:hypothetical protein